MINCSHNDKDKRIGFDRKLTGLVNWRGQIKLHDIVLDGLADIQRRGDAVLRKKETGTELNATLRVPVLYFHANSEISFMGMGPRAHHNGHLDEVTINATISYDAKLEQIKLLQFKLDSIKDVRVRLDSRFLVTDAITNLVLSSTTKLFKRLTKLVIQTVLKRVLNTAVTESDILRHIMTEID